MRSIRNGFIATLSAGLLWGQSSNVGALSVTVLDPGGAVITNAELTLRDLGTNDTRRAQTQASGVYTFPNLQFGAYQLTISAAGFQNQMFESVQVQAARTSSINATLQIGATNQTVTVTATGTPLIEPDSSVLANTIDTKQVVNLPVNGRSVMSLAFLVPGWATTGGVGSTSGTWNNMPGGAVVGADFDGTPGISNRFRSGGFAYGTTAVQPRIEDVAEMTIQTGQLDLSGIGTSAMRVSVVTRRGTNAFHGRIFEDFRNTALNANSWSNNARKLPRNIIKLNDFGGSAGGPIKRNKLFLFGTWAQSIEPRTSNAAATVLSQSAQQGLFSYRDSSGAIQTINLLQIAGAAGFPSRVNASVASSLQAINGTYSQGILTPDTDPNILSLGFQYRAKVKTYFPTMRLDWNASEKLRLFLSYGQTRSDSQLVNAPQFPGNLPQDKSTYVSNKGNNRIAGFGVDYSFNARLVNQFHAGYLYQLSVFDVESLGIDLPNIYRQAWPYGLTSPYGNSYPRRPISSFYPLLNAVDNLSWQKGSHQFTFGASWFREQDHYWNGPGGEPNYTFGLDSLDPATNVINNALAGQSTVVQGNARSLYALLAARVSQVSIGVGRPLDVQTGQYKAFGSYNLNEVQQAGGFWAQDRWRLRPNLTLNYGLRWDIYGDNHDISGFYSSPPTLGDLWGPTPLGVVNSPGNLGGVKNPVFEARKHVYNSQKMNPSPAVALAWSPSRESGPLGKLVGKDKTVVRAGYSLRHYAEGAQNYWAFASNSGQFFFQQGVANPGNGAFTAGSLSFGDALPKYVLTPSTYATTVPAANQWGNTFWGINPSIKMPYVQQWNFSVQRQLGSGSLIEARYVGNLSLHQWLGYNVNEVNIVENGFLKEFQSAQANLRINQQNGRGNSFASNGLAGQSPLPIFTGALGTAAANFTNSTYINNLLNGEAGTLAQTLANNRQFFCNLVGRNSFAPCLTNNVVASDTGAGYPINFWKVNPYANGVNYLDSAGHTNYHSLQLDFRQRLWHGMQFNGNYTLAKSLGIAAQNGIQGQGNNIYYTQRNFKLNYGPSLFDIRHVMHVSGTYDLPFGKGKPFLSQSGIADRVLGGWTVGTIIVAQSGNPAQITGAFNTFNNNSGTAGVVLNGVTTSGFRQSISVQRTGNPWVITVDPKFIGPNGAANPTYLTPLNTAGVLGSQPFVYGPGWMNVDMSVNKYIKIREGVRVLIQTELLNTFNHPTFGLGSLGVLSNTFGQATNGNAFSAARRIELRANIEF